MSKKDFSSGGQNALSSFFGGSAPLADAPAASTAGGEPLNSQVQGIPSGQVTADAIHSTSTPASSPASMVIKPKKKKTKDKAVNFLVNSDDYKQFSQKADELGYTKNELINKFIGDFLDANK